MNEDAKWHAIVCNDADADGLFYYGVSTTGVFCRPSCPSRTPAREHVRFFDTCAAALDAGFRPCKRCRPDQAEPNPALLLARKTRTLIDRHHTERAALARELEELGLSWRRVSRIFKEHYGVTPAQYADSLRIRTVTGKLAQTESAIIDIALSSGFDSLSAFYAFFHKHEGTSPLSYRKKHRTGREHEDFAAVYQTTLGPITIAGTAREVTRLFFGTPDQPLRPCALTDTAAGQVREYLAGRRKTFDLPLRPHGTPFQQRVWQALLEIPYGETRTYKDIAARLGNPNGSRAVGMANNKNPIGLLIPCHRVIGANGALVGYAAGLEIKQRLLQLERENSRPVQGTLL